MAATPGAWFQLITPTAQWMRNCEKGHPASLFPYSLRKVRAELVSQPPTRRIELRGL